MIMATVVYFFVVMPYQRAKERFFPTDAALQAQAEALAPTTFVDPFYRGGNDGRSYGRSFAAAWDRGDSEDQPALQEALNRNARAISEAMVGSVQKVLVEKPSTRNPSEFTGRTENMRYVNFAGHPRLVGQFVDVLITDDGLQHYALARDVEIILFDGRGTGNGWTLPAGPLEEGMRALAD